MYCPGVRLVKMVAEWLVLEASYLILGVLHRCELFGNEVFQIVILATLCIFPHCQFVYNLHGQHMIPYVD